ncbi:SusC/RagA family TonB-linked outer membrane protein [Dysgonomonas termitidis]|uniref:SusC/RagA family TonB-linked outer membrane protein n=1 Tax=Dysgonomonas termitidis TaxID=1516126 RepID=A0ABV9KRS4_9BACT
MKKRVVLVLSCLLLSIGFTVAQTTRISGTVVDSNGEPVISASVVVKGTLTGTVTDPDGNFTLNVPDGSKTLVVSLIGMVTQEVAVAPNLKIELQTDTRDLDAVVVTAMGLSRKEKSLGYATQQVKSEDLVKVRQTDLNNALVGKVSGVRFLGGSGAKFDAGKIVLRGTNSLTNAGGNEPIYVLDGVIANVNSLNMDDVESVNVLKGPAATALYGSRGGNGAIIITTKGNTGEKTEINVSHTLAFEKVYLHNKLQKEYGGGYYGADAEMDVFEYDPAIHPKYLEKLNGLQYYDYADDASWGPKFDGREYAPWYAWDPTHPKFGQTEKWESRMNLADLFETGVSNTTNIALSKSGKDYMSRISFTNAQRDGVTPNSDAVRRFLAVKTQFKPLDRLTVSLDYKYTYRKNHNAAAEGYGGLGNALYSYQQWGQTNVDLKDLKDYKRPDGSFRSWNITSPDNLTPQFHDNPFALFNEINKNDIYQWNVFNATATLDIIGNLKAGLRVNGNIRNRNNETTVPMNILGEVSKYEQEQSSVIDTQVQGFLTWNGSFLQNRLTVDAALFAEQRDYVYDITSAFTRDGLFLDKFFSTAASSGLPGGSTSRSKLKEQSIFGTGTLGWDNTYYLDFSLRNDWSSTLHPDKNNYLYGGLSGAAILSNLVKTDWLSFWKLRASIAQVGSTIDPYNIYQTYKLKDGDGNLVKYGSLSNMWLDRNLKDPYIKPTISTSYEIGMDVRLFDSRLWADVNYYTKDSKDQIINVNTTPVSGYTSRKMNAGLIRNRGIELTIGGKPVQTKNWDWVVNANISKNKNTLEELVEGTDSYQIYWMSWSTRIYSYAEVGKPIGVIRGSTWKKNDKGQIILSDRGNPNHALGQYAPLLEASAQEELGNIQPDFTGGFSTSLRYKDFSLGASFDFQIGGDIASATNMFGEGSGLLTSTVGLNDKGNPIRSSVADGGGVRVDGVVDRGNGNFEAVTAYVDANYYYQGRKSLIWEDYVYDASYLKLRELSLTYDVPGSFLRNTVKGIKKASLSFVAQNPWLIYSGAPNIDPSESGGATYNYIEGGQAASTRSFGFTVNLTF